MNLVASTSPLRLCNSLDFTYFNHLATIDYTRSGEFNTCCLRIYHCRPVGVANFSIIRPHPLFPTLDLTTS